MQVLAHDPAIIALGVLILALVGALGWHLGRRGRQTSPGPDTRVQRALTASEAERDALRQGSATASHVARHRPTPAVVVPTQTTMPVPPPRAAYYDRLRRNADEREALTTELTVISPEQIEADRQLLLKPLFDSMVDDPPVSTGERSLLDMTVPELMAQIEAEAQTALIPKLDGAPVLPGLPDRRIHASLPDGSEVVRYDKAGKWFHEGPGLRRKLTLGQAAVLATSKGAIVRPGVPGGGLFDLRVQKAREEG